MKNTTELEISMMPDQNGKTSRVAYVNGKIVPEDQACISIRDLGLVYGDCIFDTARTFNGKLFRLEQHVDRLFENLAYAKISCELSKVEIIEITQEVVRQNLPALRDGEDYWVTQRITSGMQSLDGEPKSTRGATVIVECIPLPLRARARYFSEGVTAAVADRRRISPDALSPNAKTNNYLNMMLAQRETQEKFPGSWALMCDPQGFLAEGAGCNIFVVSEGKVFTPTREYILPGVSRGIAMDICGELGMELEETNFSVEFALGAEEAFLTSTSLCACPIKSIDEHNYSGSVPGPVTQKVMNEFAKLVGMDYVKQYLDFLEESEGSTGL